MIKENKIKLEARDQINEENEGSAIRAKTRTKCIEINKENKIGSKTS
jgi:hypothetical protein